MTRQEWANWHRRNALRVRRYMLGGDGKDGLCDCIGLSIGAWRLSGAAWPWTHGSNYAARYLTEGLRTDAPLRVGDWVYKYREPGDQGYALPTRYRGQGDQRDYYHVGIVISTRPLAIWHCTSGRGCQIWDGEKWIPSSNGGIKFDSTRGAWRASGHFKLIQEDMPMQTGDSARVTAPNGKTVNLRKRPQKNAPILAAVPVGDAAIITQAEDGGWYGVKWQEHEGYMMAEYLTPAEGPQEPAALLRRAQQLMNEADSLITKALEAM